VQPTTDGNYILGGFSYSFGDGINAHAYMVKVAADGSSILWEKTYGMIGSAEGWSVIQTSDGGFLMGGDIILDGFSDLDWMLIKTDPEGNVPPLSSSFPAAFEQNEGSNLSINTSGNFDLVQGEPGATLPLTFTAIGLPPGISINPTTGLISGTLPTLTADTVYRITVIATDPEGLSAAETLTLTVRNTN